MEDGRRLIFFIIAGLIILAAVLAVVLTLKRSERTKSDLLGESVSNLPQTSSVSPSTTPTPAANLKVYQGRGFSVRYPASWGLLTCNNSANFEFDPYGGEDQKINCNYALKPVTAVVVPQLSCQGETARIGNYPVVKSKTVDSQGEVQYRWCVNLGGQSLDITHRVFSQAPAASRDDFSSQIQQMIFDIQTGAAGS